MAEAGTDQTLPSLEHLVTDHLNLPTDRGDQDEGCLEHFVGGCHNHQDHHRLQNQVHQVELDGEEVLLPPSLHGLIRQAMCNLVVSL